MNDFIFDGQNYLQTKETVMETTAAPNFNKYNNNKYLI